MNGYDWKKSALKALVGGLFVLAGALAAVPPDVVASYLPLPTDPWMRGILMALIGGAMRALNNWVKNRDK